MPGRLGGQMVCLDLAGKHVWESGPKYRFGLGPWMIADGLLFAMDDEGTLTMAEATSAGFKPLGTAKVLDGHETWAPMAISAGRLLVRGPQPPRLPRRAEGVTPWPQANCRRRNSRTT